MYASWECACLFHKFQTSFQSFNPQSACITSKALLRLSHGNCRLLLQPYSNTRSWVHKYGSGMLEKEKRQTSIQHSL